MTGSDQFSAGFAASRGLGVVFVFLLFCAVAVGDVLHLKGGRRLDGKIVAESPSHVSIETKFGVQKIARSSIERMERGATPEERIKTELAALAADDADGHYRLFLEAKEANIRRLSEKLQRRVLEIDPQHKGMNELLGNVLYQGRYVSRADRDRLEKEARRQQMREQGLVEYEGRFVTPEEKQKLERGLVLRDGKWINQAEAMAEDGFVRVGDEWIPQAEHHLTQVDDELAKVLGRRFQLARGDHVAVHTDLGQEFADKLAKVLEKGYMRFVGEFALDPALDWVPGRRRIDFFVFKKRRDYQQFVDFLGREKGMGTQWSSRARDVVSFYRFHNWAMASTYVANRGQTDAAAHSANMLGHVLLNMYRGEGRTLPPFFDECYAALMEFDLLGANHVYTLGSSRYERQLNEDDLNFFQDGKWMNPLKDAMRARGDTPLDVVVRREFGDLSQLDIGKGMALYVRWRDTGDGTVKKFIDALRDNWPDTNLPANHVKVQAAIRAAFHEVEGKDIPPVDQELREFVLTRMK